MGLILKELRKKTGITQKQPGNKIGVSEGMISRYENNMSEPPFDTMRSFAAILSVSMDYLAGTEKQRGIPTTGLTEHQITLLRELSEILCVLNSGDKPRMTADQYEVVGRIVAELFK